MTCLTLCFSHASLLPVPSSLQHQKEMGLENEDRPLWSRLPHWSPIPCQYSDSCSHLPCEAKYPPTNVTQSHICLFPCCPSPAWLESPPSQQSSLLLLFKIFPRKDAIPTRQLLINSLVLFLLNATFLGSLCVTGSPAQVHDWGFTLVPHTIAQHWLSFFYENYSWAVRRCVSGKI